MAKGKPQKKRAYNPKLDKTPLKLQNPISYDSMPFIWRVHDGLIDYEHPEFGWHKVDILDFLKNIVKRLQSYEGQLWHDMKRNRHCHPWGLDAIPKECSDRLGERQIDINELYQIPIGSIPRIIGYKTGNTFYLMWWDAEHKFCPTKVK